MLKVGKTGVIWIYSPRRGFLEKVKELFHFSQSQLDDKLQNPLEKAWVSLGTISDVEYSYR